MKKKIEKAKTYGFETLTSPSTMKKIKGGACGPQNQSSNACNPEKA